MSKKSDARRRAAAARQEEHALNREKKAYDKVIRRYRLDKPKAKGKGVVAFPDYSSDAAARGLPPTSDKVGNGFKRDITTDHLWRRGEAERPEVVAGIHAKALAIQPLFSKGATQYATPGHDHTTDGRRRT